MNTKLIKRLNDTGIPYKIYAETLEETALIQFTECLEAEGVVQAALMPDAHTGYVVPIGSVIKTKGIVYCSYIGYDIGCGVCAAKLNITKDKVNLEQLKNYILKNIPLGFSRHKDAKNVELPLGNITGVAMNLLAKKGRYQIGTLGGGNHFIEIGESENDGKLWIIIHSGSRGFGHGIAEHYMKQASALHAEPFDDTDFRAKFVEKNENLYIHNFDAWKRKFDKQLKEAKEKHIKNQDIEGHFGFDINSDLGKAYLTDMEFALEFALMNRYKMVGMIMQGIREQVPCEEIAFINRNHNHAELKDGYVIHRKGATHAEKGMHGVIPANMRDGAFIVEGLGNKDSMCSSSHGAGRVLSRAQARKTLDADVFKIEMEKITTNHTEKMLDESPEAYKNIFEVMELQKDLVKIKDRSIPILNIKG